MQNMRQLMGSDSRLRHDLTVVLINWPSLPIISALADFIQHHPNALLTGRKSTLQK
jgi:hypothetical protein